MIKLKILREQAGLSQMELAEKLNVGQSTIAMWENGTNAPRADKLPLLAKIFDCKIDDLFVSDKSA